MRLIVVLMCWLSIEVLITKQLVSRMYPCQFLSSANKSLGEIFDLLLVDSDSVENTAYQ